MTVSSSSLVLFAAVALVQTCLLVALIRGIRSLARAEQRVTRFGEALSLLTETCDAGFRTMSHEITRWSDGAPVAARPRVPTRRLKQAVRRGDTVDAIAAAEQMAEGEVRLRLFLADPEHAHTRAGGR